MPPAEFPYDRDVDREALEKRRTDQLRIKRLVEIRRRLRKAAGITVGQRRPPGAPPATQRKTLRLTVDEERRLEQLADDMLLSVESLLRACFLAAADELEGKP
jgi:hypothetical protein